MESFQQEGTRMELSCIDEPLLEQMHCNGAKAVRQWRQRGQLLG